MKQGFRDDNPFPQPLPGFSVNQVLHGLEEEVSYLPGTKIRVWFTYLPTAYPIHWHKCMEIIEGVHSYYTCQINQQTYVISPGNILIIPGGVNHNLTPGPYCNGWIYLFDLEWMRMIPSCQSASALPTEPVLVSQQKTPLLYMNISSQLFQMRNDYFSNNSARELLFNAGVLRVMEQLLSYRQEDAYFIHSQLDKRHAHEALFNQVINYIDQNFSKDLTLDDISRQFNLSNAYFSRLFTQYIHESFSDYLAHRRLKEAETLLADSSFPITDVALRCGYGSPSAFSRAFLAQHKCTPSQFRKIYARFSSDVGGERGRE